VGAGLKTERWFKQIFNERDRTKSGDTASSAGLYLVSVGYPEACDIPDGPNSATLLSHRI
jgi:tRNA U38,U39,U40 pseudouridine synthase TruA